MKKWTQQEEEQLKELASSKSITEIAKQFKVGYGTIRDKMLKLGLEAKETTLSSHKSKIIEKNDKQVLNKLLKEQADKDIIFDILKDIIPKISFKPKAFKSTVKSINNEVAVLNLSDIHIGRYEIEILEKKINTLVAGVLKTISIQRQGSTINELVINMVGDIVDGDGIFPTQAYEQKFHLMEQMFGKSLPIMINMLNELSNHFEKITINCVRGNHGRVSKYTDEKLNFDTIFYNILKISTSDNTRLVWNISDKWYQIVKILKFGFLLTHGNYIKTWLNIPFYGIKEKGMRWQGSLTKQETIQLNQEWVRIQKEYWDYIIIGHFHTSLYFRWNNWRCILNGTWLDKDDFAESVLGLDSATEQTLFGVHEKRGITWMRNIDLSL